MNKCLHVLLCLFASLFAVLFCACSEEETVVQSISENGHVYSPSKLSISADIGKIIDVTGAWVVRLNDSFNPIDTIPTEFGSGSFSTKTVEFSTPFVKVLLEGRGTTQKNRMEFAYYRDISDSSQIQVGFEESLVESKIESLLKEGKGMGSSRKSALEMLEKVVGPDWKSDWYYHLCRSQKSDSVFYEDLLELRSLLKEHGVDSDLEPMMIRAADELFESYSKYEFLNNSFVDYVYGWEGCEDWSDEGDSVEVKNPLSKYNGEILVCDKVTLGAISRDYVWRPLLEDEKMLGKRCMYGWTDSLIYGNDLYICDNRYSDGPWKKDTNRVYVDQVILDSRVAAVYGTCNEDVFEHVLRYFNDTLFICKGYLSGKGFWMPDSEFIDRHYISKTYKCSNPWLDSAMAFGDACMNRDVGACDSTMNGREEKACDGYFRCDGSHSITGVWKPISAEDFGEEE